MYIHLLRYSKVCIEPLGACPSCGNEKYDTFLDEAINEKLLPLEVQCKYYKEGCHWRKQLCFQEEHLKEECHFRKMECHYGCDEKIHFCKLERHERDECIQRPPEAKMETIEKRIEDLANEQRNYEQRIQKLSVHHDAKLIDELTPLKDYLKLELVDEMTLFEQKLHAQAIRHDTKLTDEIASSKREQNNFVDKKLEELSNTIRQQRSLLIALIALMVLFVSVAVGVFILTKGMIH